jgi:hypothetical protein
MRGQHLPTPTDGELLHLALLLAQQELGIDITMAPSWSSLGTHLRAFYERSAEVFLESLARREAGNGRTHECGTDPEPGHDRGR